MAYVGQNILFQLGAAFDFRGHVVEILRQPANLIPVHHRDLDIVVARSDFLGTGGKPLDGAGEPAAEQHGEQQIQYQQEERQRNQNGAQHFGGGGNLCQTGGDDDAVFAVGGQRTHQHLLAGTGADHLEQTAVLEEFLAHLDDHSGVDVVAELSCECTGAFVEQTGVHAFVGFEAAQGRVAEIHTAAIHIDGLFPEGIAQVLPEIGVQRQHAKVPGGDGGVALVDEGHNGRCFVFQFAADGAVVLRHQRIGDHAPYQRQCQQRHEADAKHQLPAYADHKPPPFLRGRRFQTSCTPFYRVSGSNL